MMKEGITVRHIAIAINNNHLRMFQKLDLSLELLNKRDREGRSVIFYTEKLDKIKHLINLGVDVNICDENDRNMLFYADTSLFDSYEKIKLLIDSGINVNKRDIIGRTVLFYMTSLKNIKCVIDGGIDINILNNYGRTALFTCVNEINKMRMLVESGADVNIKDETGSTILFYVDKIEEMDYLLKCGIDVNCKDDEGRTVLFYVDSLAKIKLLLKYGANKYIRDNKGCLPRPYIQTLINERWVWNKYDFKNEYASDITQFIRMYTCCKKMDRIRLNPCNLFDKTHGISRMEKFGFCEFWIKQMK